MKDALKGKTNQCFTASNGYEALEFVRENREIDLIFMDVNMTGKSGFQTAKEIKHFLKTNNFIMIPIIAISGDEKIRYMSKEDSGMDEFLMKPVSIH